MAGCGCGRNKSSKSRLSRKKRKIQENIEYKKRAKKLRERLDKNKIKESQ